MRTPPDRATRGLLADDLARALVDELEPTGDDGVPTARRTLADGRQFDMRSRRVGDTFLYGVGRAAVSRT